jgi:hypothetical protein
MRANQERRCLKETERAHIATTRVRKSATGMVTGWQEHEEHWCWIAS